MKENELMTGDILLYNDNGTIVVVSVVRFERDFARVKRNGGHVFNVVIESLQPAPITPEFLGLFGFDSTPDGMQFMLDGANHIYVQFHNEGRMVNYVEIYIADKIDIRARNIQYIHQLQHVIRFCDIDGLTM